MRPPLIATVAGLLALAWLLQPGAAQSTLPVRAVIGMAAADGLPTPLPPPDPSYCRAPGGPGSTPPISLFGTLTINGQAAPAGTIVQTVFDGKVGPARFTTQAGGYRLDYDVGGGDCSNKVGASIGVLVRGHVVDTGMKVGEAVAGEPVRFDIALP